MKYKTALTQAKNAVKFLAVALPLMVLAYIYFRHWALAMFAVAMAFFLVLEIATIVSIRRRAQEDPSFLDRRLN
jgi:formate/nitrite transporter FocA (FNT family)